MFAKHRFWQDTNDYNMQVRRGRSAMTTETTACKETVQPVFSSEISEFSFIKPQTLSECLLQYDAIRSDTESVEVGDASIFSSEE
jgi:hypothetical protein